MALTVASTLQLGPTWVAQYAIIMSMAGFYAAQWEECVSPHIIVALACSLTIRLTHELCVCVCVFRYHTGVLDLGYFNVTEAQLSTMALYVATGIVGPNVWLQTFTAFGYTIPYNTFFVALATFPMLQNIFSRFGHVPLRPHSQIVC
jgi:hypothetical protein